MIRAAALTLLLLIAVTAYAVLAPLSTFSGDVYVDIPKGATTREMASLLAQNGVIRHPVQFLAVRALRPRTTLQAGEYRFRQAASAWDVFGRIARGDIFYYSLVVPEGHNLYDIAAALEQQEIMPAAAFVKAAQDASAIRDLDPRAPTLEGYLFPDTYRLNRHTAPEQLCRQMTERFRKAWSGLRTPTAAVHETVTLASLVEEEAKVPGERPLIASVFLNRLRIGMPLQCDPTAIYAALIESRYRGTIYRSDLDNKQLYNTYQHAGLPPGPISNPGLASLQAALAPAASDYLYFVARADGSGAHQFSSGLAEHTRAVQEYRRGLHQGQQTNGIARVR